MCLACLNRLLLLLTSLHCYTIHIIITIVLVWMWRPLQVYLSSMMVAIQRKQSDENIDIHFFTVHHQSSDAIIGRSSIFDFGIQVVSSSMTTVATDWMNAWSPIEEYKKNKSLRVYVSNEIVFVLMACATGKGSVHSSTFDFFPLCPFKIEDRHCYCKQFHFYYASVKNRLDIS